MATVITNLLSAIPWIGVSLVEFVWGGLCRLIKTLIEEPYNSNVIIRILLIAVISLNLEVIYFYIRKLYIGVKIITTRGQTAGVREISTLEASQRLNAEDLSYAYLVGLIEGDGWFSVTKKEKYLTYELGIELSIKDVQLIYKIKNLLGVGVIVFRKLEHRPETVILRVRDKSHLIKFILPIFDKYPMISNKQYDYLRFKDALLSGIIYYKDLPEYKRPINPLNSVESILSVPYLSAWLIGFIEAEGCFSIYKPTKESSLVASFDVSQINGHILILAISKYLCLTQSVNVDKTNNYKIKVSSVRSVENVIKFIQKAPVKLLGNKKLQYLLWLKEIRTIPRYSKKIKIPNKY